MAYVLTDESNYEDIADAIREMNGTSDTYTPSQMAGAIRNIRAGVTGVKGNAESEYRSGDVNITPGNVGAKATQTPVADPTASGNTAAFIASISQDAQGVITATKKTVRVASSSQSGLMSSADKAALDKAVTDIIALQAALAAAETQRLAMYPTDTAEGASVAISDGADNLPLKAMQLRIASESGVTGATITRRGKNIAEIENGTYSYAGTNGMIIRVRDGVVTIEGDYGGTGAINRTIGTVPLLAGVTYAISGTKSSGITDANVLRIDLRNPGGSVIASGDSYNGFTYTPAADVTAQINIRVASGQTLDVTLYPQVEVGRAATDFVPNTPTTYEIDWTETAGSAHDVTLDVLTGALTADGDAYTVTPVDVRTLLGANTFSCDAGTLSVTWRADIGLYVASKIAEALNA